MRIEDRLLGNLSVRSLCIAILMIGAFLVVHGFLKRLAEGGYLLECLLGIVVSVIAIIIAAIPSKKSDYSLGSEKK
ncbi:MAG TPA: hypothetical protein VGD14_14775 [bacterium]